jgi:NAD(P)-dependent dehydrogenase (short-subunit alcohol dehydrogenase family)
MPTTTTDKPHAGRVALVTGAARGIGQPIAVGLAERGASVVLGDIDEPRETAELIAGTGSSAVTARLDISDPFVIEAVRRRVADELGRVDILVNNAAIFEAATWDDLDFELWQRIMSVNLNGADAHVQVVPAAYERTRLGPRHQRRLGDRSDRKPSLDRLSRRKMGVIGFTRALSATFGDDGITINAVLPSLTRTAMTDGLPQPVVEASLSRQVIHREAEAADIAGSVYLLASDDAGWITGQTLLANGGNAFGL